jgi:glutamate--cysteine ligase
MTRNQRRIAERGRDPKLRLHRTGHINGGENGGFAGARTTEAVLADVALADLPPADREPAEWGRQLLAECEPIAAALDAAYGGAAYRDALAAALAALGDFDVLPSARVLRQVEREYGKSFPAFVQAQSALHRKRLLEEPLRPEAAARFAQQAEESLREQLQREAADDISFEEFRQRYLNQELMDGAHFRDVI